MNRTKFFVIGGFYWDKKNGNPYIMSKIINADNKKIYYTLYTWGTDYINEARHYIEEVLYFNKYEIIDGGCFDVKKTKLLRKDF